MRTKLLTVVALFAIVLACSWALLEPEFFRTHDYVHGARIAEMSRALQDGHFPPRWSANFGFGYGMPLFEFYAPLPFFIGALFFMAGAPLILASKAIFLIPNLVTVLAAYKLGKSLFNRAGGIIVAAALTLAPYRAVNLFVRGAVSEAWGMMAMVVALYGLVRTFQKKRGGWIVLFFGMVTLALSHNLSLLMFSIFAPLLAAVLIIHDHFLNKRRLSYKDFSLTFTQNRIPILQAVGSALLALLASAFYLLPAFLEKDFTHVQDAVTGGFFVYNLHFLYLRQFLVPNWGYGGSIWGIEDDISFFLGYGQLFMAAAVLGAGALGIFKQNVYIKKFKFPLLHLYLACMFLALTFASLLLTTFKSQFIWNAIPLFAFFQFPWRFLSVATLLLGVAAGAISYLLPTKSRTWVTAGIVCVFIVLNFHYFQPEEFLNDSSMFYYDAPDRIQHVMSGVLYDYIPKGLPLDNTPPEVPVRCSATPDSCPATLVQKATHTQTFHTELSTSQTLLFSVANFPGWEVIVNGEQVPVKDADGLVSAMIPSGTQRVEVRFGSTPVRNTADVISLLAWGVAATLLLLQASRVTIPTRYRS